MTTLSMITRDPFRCHLTVTNIHLPTHMTTQSMITRDPLRCHLTVTNIHPPTHDNTANNNKGPLKVPFDSNKHTPTHTRDNTVNDNK